MRIYIGNTQYWVTRIRSKKNTILKTEYEEID